MPIPKVPMSAAERSLKGRRAIALRYGRTEEAERLDAELTLERANTLETEAKRLRREVEALTGPAA
ncbi:hypothetical protein ACQEV2_11840 [Streptomyces sp. CA-251387]|uniref:hypothetical protein n=1 Tax=Streptomyces sp. CA-251387 TaxID=3240064 RepID=UPI003D8E5343